MKFGKLMHLNVYTALLFSAALMSFSCSNPPASEKEPSYSVSELVQASRDGDLKRVKSVLKDVKETGRYGDLALLRAAEKGRLEVIKYLMGKGAVVTVLEDPDRSALSAASWHGHMGTVKFLLEKGVDPDLGGGKPLISACTNGHIEIVRLLLKSGARADGVEGSRLKPLVTACVFGRYSIAELLLKSGADVNRRENPGGTALIAACSSSLFKGSEKTRTAAMLLKAGADPNIREDYSGKTALIALKYWDEPGRSPSYEVVSLLLEKRALVNVQDREGRTALMNAANVSNLKAVQLLLKAGADVHLKSSEGKTAFMLAAGTENPNRKKDSMEILKLLLKSGSEINLKDKNGYTAVDYAGMHHWTEEVSEFLRAHGGKGRFQN